MNTDLTDREREIAIKIACGMSNREIGTALGISHGTIKNHCTNIYKKWKVNDRVQCAVVVFALGWVTPFEAYQAMVGRME